MGKRDGRTSSTRARRSSARPPTESGRSYGGRGHGRRREPVHAAGRGTRVGDAPIEFIGCTNPRCWNGGFALGSVVGMMEGGRERERIFSQPCRGYKGSRRAA